MTEDTPTPSVSCLMVSRGRLEMAKRSIRCYLRQDYVRRNLVIVSDGVEEHGPLEAYVRSLGRTDITIQSVHRDRYSLGALRNLAVQGATGDLICQWDDDDLFHPRRLSCQVLAMQSQNAGACFMSEQLQLITATGALHWCDWARPRERPSWPPLIPNTLMCERRVAVSYPETGELSRRSEDLAFMHAIGHRCRVAKLAGWGELYIYVTHGANTWDQAHHLRIPRITGLDRDELLRRRTRMEAALRSYELPCAVMVKDFSGQTVYCPEFSCDVGDETEMARTGAAIPHRRRA